MVLLYTASTMRTHFPEQGLRIYRDALSRLVGLHLAMKQIPDENLPVLVTYLSELPD